MEDKLGSPFYSDGGISFLEAARCDPSLIFVIIDEWFTDAVNVMRVIENAAASATLRPLDFDDNADRISLWCDAMHRGVSPEPILQFTREVSARVSLEWKPVIGEDNDQVEFRAKGNAPRKRADRPTHLEPDDQMRRTFKLVCVTRQRLLLLANLEYFRELGERGKPDERDLATLVEIARTINCSERTLEEWKSAWPPPVEPARGRRGARWSYQQLLPILKSKSQRDNLPQEVKRAKPAAK